MIKKKEFIDFCHFEVELKVYWKFDVNKESINKKE